MVLQHKITVNGVELSLYEWEGKAPTILFVHATGFHGRVWDQVIQRLMGSHCFALDQRGHGMSGKPADPPDWRWFAEDVAALGDRLGWSGLIGVGHSLGGHALTAAAAARPALFRELLLIDPVIMREEQYVGVVDYAQFTAKRRNEWASHDEMFQRFKTRAPFDRWNEAVLHDYVTYGLKEKPNGEGYVLACEPTFEAANYSYGMGANIYPLVTKVTIPVTVVRAAEQTDENLFSGSPTAPDLASRFARGRDVHLPQYSHFIPMEAPEVVADMVSAMISAEPS